MKASKAFYKTLKFIMNGVNTIFSFGVDRPVTNYLLIPLFLLGKLAKYTLGFLLGIILGGLAAFAISIINLFKAEKKQKKRKLHMKNLKMIIKTVLKLWKLKTNK